VEGSIVVEVGRSGRARLFDVYIGEEEVGRRLYFDSHDLYEVVIRDILVEAVDKAVSMFGRDLVVGK